MLNHLTVAFPDLLRTAFFWLSLYLLWVFTSSFTTWLGESLPSLTSLPYISTSKNWHFLPPSSPSPNEECSL